MFAIGVSLAVDAASGAVVVVVASDEAVGSVVEVFMYTVDVDNKPVIAAARTVMVAVLLAVEAKIPVPLHDS